MGYSQNVQLLEDMSNYIHNITQGVVNLDDVIYWAQV